MNARWKINHIGIEKVSKDFDDAIEKYPRSILFLHAIRTKKTNDAVLKLNVKNVYFRDKYIKIELCDKFLGGGGVINS